LNNFNPYLVEQNGSDCRQVIRPRCAACWSHRVHCNMLNALLITYLILRRT